MVKNYDLEVVEVSGDTLMTPVYDIVISESRYNDGLREKNE